MASAECDDSGREGEKDIPDRPVFTGTRLFTPSPRNRPTHSDYTKAKAKTIRDWGLKYDGNAKSIPAERFLFRVETLRKRHRISSEELYANFHLLVSGAAQEWFWLHMEESADAEGDVFGQLREALVEHFRKAECDEEIRQAMNERKQDNRESFDNFYAYVRGLAMTMKTQMPKLSLVNLIRKNLKAKVKNLIFGCQITTLAELKSECRRAEKHFEEYERKFSKRTEVDEIGLPLGEEHTNVTGAPIVEAFERRGRGDKTKDNAGRPADAGTRRKHTEQGCDSQFHDLRCYKCDQVGARLTICEKCEGGNRIPGGSTGSSGQEKELPETH